MLIRVHASTKQVHDTDIKHAYVLDILLGRVTKFPPLSHADMAGFSKAATHAVSQLKWTPHRGESADVITRLLCHSGTIQDSQIFVLFFYFLSFLLQMYWANLQAMSLFADHQCNNCLSQRGLEHSPKNSVQCSPHIPRHSSQRDHPGGRRQCGW